MFMKLRIKELRTDRGLTIDKMVGMTGLSRGFISQLENGKREPSFETLEQIAAAFSIHVRDLIADDEGSQDLLTLMDKARGLSPADVKTLVRLAEALASQS